MIVGNPPFLGNKKMLAGLGEAYTGRLRHLFTGRLPSGVDLVIYWFEKARAQIEAGQCVRAGLVATQSIRKGASRTVLDRICATSTLIEAWRDEPWVNNGAAVRVSLVAFGTGGVPHINGKPVASIQPDLTADTSGGDLTTAKALKENAGTIYQGTSKVGDFDVPGAIARDWLRQPNPNGRVNSEVVRPWANGQALTGRPLDTWIIDFGTTMSEVDAALFELPFAHVLARVKPFRMTLRRPAYQRYWWRHAEARPGMRRAMAGLSRFIATIRVAKHRFFVWLPVAVLPDSRLYTICRDDDVTFGVLSSRIHVVWALANASRHGVGNDPTYNARDCFETFPFPAGMTPHDTAKGAPTGAQAEAVASAANHLNNLRESWLNPVEWADRISEVVPSYPDRIVAKPGHEADLKKRTLTKLYNARPPWLDNAHKALDMAVADAYGWTEYAPEMPDEEILRRLLALNERRA